MGPIPRVPPQTDGCDARAGIGSLRFLPPGADKEASLLLLVVRSLQQEPERGGHLATMKQCS
jgi:hypothetical protein